MVNGRLLITGATGLLGNDLVSVLKQDYDTFGVATIDFDIQDYDKTAAFIDSAKPDVVLHAAALADVNECEKLQEKAFSINAVGTKNIALACKTIGAKMIYYSTDYVFDGTKGTAYSENDKTNPINIYGQSKLEGEQYVLDILDTAAIMRISWLYSTAKECFVTYIIRTALEQVRVRQKNENYQKLKVIGDQFSCPTWTVDIAKQTKVIIEKKISGVIHAASVGHVSRYQLAEDIFEELAWDVEMDSIKGSDLSGLAQRPPRTDMDNGRLNMLGLSVMRDYKDALLEFLKVQKKNGNRINDKNNM